MDWDTIPSIIKPKPSTPATPAPAAPDSGYPSEFGNVAPPPSLVVNPNAPVQVSQTPLQTFVGDIAIPAGVLQYIDIQTIMGSACVGFVIIPQGVVAALPMVSINGGGFRTIPSTMVVDESIIYNLNIQTFLPDGGVILQLNGA